MTMTTVAIPQDILESARLTTLELKVEMAVYLYASGRLSVGKARELADMSLWQFRQLLASRQISPHLSEADVEAELKTLFPRIITAEPLPAWHLKVQFADGLEKVMDLSPFIRESGISAPLRDEDYFVQLFVEEGGGIAWPNGFDFCPVFLRQDVPAVILDEEPILL